MNWRHLVLIALTVTTTGYAGHPAKVARTEQRRLERQYANPASLWYGANVSVECTRLTRLTDDCQATIDPPHSQTDVWIDGTAYISANGKHFRMVWN